MANFLLEIGVEEIPDWMIEPALAELHKRFADAFAAFGGFLASGEIRTLDESFDVGRLAD